MTIGKLTTDGKETRKCLLKKVLSTLGYPILSLWCHDWLGLGCTIRRVDYRDRYNRVDSAFVAGGILVIFVGLTYAELASSILRQVEHLSHLVDQLFGDGAYQAPRNS